MINRRALCNIAASSLLAATFGVAAQQPAKLPRIGFLGMDSGMQAARVAAFQDELVNNKRPPRHWASPFRQRSVSARTR